MIINKIRKRIIFLAMLVPALGLISGCEEDNFVGGIVIGNDKPITLLEVHSESVINIAANPNGQTEFKFNEIEIGVPFEFVIVDDSGSYCSQTDNKGIYDGFPYFAAKFQCEDSKQQRWSGNPIIRNQYTADPTLLEDDGYLYLYAGRDETSLLHMQKSRCKNNCLAEALQSAANFDITGIHIYRTQNMVDWEYIGPAIEAKNVSWMKQTWASHVIKKNDKYYLFTCSPASDIITDVAWKSIETLLSGNGIATGPNALTGVAVSDSPMGPFVDSGAPLVSYKTPGAIGEVMDPAAFTDDDGITYLFYGGGGNTQYVELSDDLLSTVGPVKDIVGSNDETPLPGFTEASYVHKRGNTYYLSYSKSKFGSAPEPLAYATADSIHGPWTYQGDILGAVDILTNHGAITRYKDQDYLFYHTGKLPGVHDGVLSSIATRAVSVQELDYDESGKIVFVKQSELGVAEVK